MVNPRRGFPSPISSNRPGERVQSNLVYPPPRTMELDPQIFAGGTSPAPLKGKELEELLFGSDREPGAGEEEEAEVEVARDSGEEEDEEENADEDEEGDGFEELFGKSASESEEEEDLGANQSSNVSNNEYAPEKAVEEGLKMVKTIRKYLKKVKLGGGWREEVWDQRVKSLKNWNPPDTLIAVCGATGSGKSSIINAVLEDNIVPTSSMRACTSVVTEIRYHDFADKRHISAEVLFLTLEEWKDELDVLLKDLQEGRPRRESDLDGEAAIAYSKVHAVYPNISLEQLMAMGVDRILALNPHVLKLLGKTKHITAKNSKTFGEKIAPYIGAGSSAIRPPSPSDDSDSDGELDDDDDKEEEEEKEEEEAEEVEESELDETDVEGQTFWPLICKVVIKCGAKALSTGAIIVDLPGVADLNVARNNMAKEYMKKANFFWILADINRAVSDKIAKDLLGEAFRYQLLNGNYDAKTITFVASKCDELQCHEVINELNLHANPECQAIQRRINKCKKQLEKHKSMREKLDKTVDSLEKRRKKLERDQKISKKRKNTERSGDPPPKRRKAYSGEGVSVQCAPSDTNDQTEYESLQEKLRKSREDQVKTRDYIMALDGQLSLLNQQKKAFCSVKRSEYSRTALQHDFRQGLRRQDEIAAEQADQQNYDPTSGSDNQAYETVNLNVFACSSRDFMALKGLIDSHESPCFSDIDQTGIPALQIWCKELTIGTRNHAAQKFLSRLSAFVLEVESYIAHLGKATAEHQKKLRKRWESRDPNVKCLNAKPRWRVAHDIPKNATGIVPRLCRAFSECIDQSVADLKKRFKATLEERCRAGAADAAKEAYRTANKFVNVGHWTQFRAAVRHHGLRNHDDNLNWQLVMPFTKSIAKAWGDLFGSDLFSDFDSSIRNKTSKLLYEIEVSAPAEIRDRAKEQGVLCLEAVNGAMREIMSSLEDTVKNRQRSISYSMEPYLRKELKGAYMKTLGFRGQGCVEEQKSYLLGYICTNIEGILERGNTTILGRLDEIAFDVGRVLRSRVGFRLAQAIEVHLAVLWEEAYNDPVQTHARDRMLKVVTEAKDQLYLSGQATQPNAKFNALKDSGHEAEDIESSSSG